MGGSQPLFQHGLYPPQKSSSYGQISPNHQLLVALGVPSSTSQRCTRCTQRGPLCFSHRSATELQRDAQQVQLLGHVEAVGVAHGGGHDEVATMLQRGLVQTFTWGWWGWWENSSGIFRKSMMWKI